MAVRHSISQPPVHPCFARAIVLSAHPKITLILAFSWGFSSKVAFAHPKISFAHPELPFLSKSMLWGLIVRRIHTTYHAVFSLSWHLGLLWKLGNLSLSMLLKNHQNFWRPICRNNMNNDSIVIDDLESYSATHLAIYSQIILSHLFMCYHIQYHICALVENIRKSICSDHESSTGLSCNSSPSFLIVM